MTLPARLSLFCALLAPGLAWAGPKEQAAKHIEAATKAHTEEKFDVALAELEKAYKLDPDPELLYAIGQVHTKLGNCDEAASNYERYQKTNKDPQVKAVIDQAIAGCQPTKPPGGDPPPGGGDAPPGGGDTPPDGNAIGASGSAGGAGGGTGPTPGAEGAPWYRGKLPYALAGAGVLAGLGSLLFYTDAHSDLDAAEKAPTLAAHDELVDNARGKRTVSVVLLGGGVALIGAGVVLYMMQGKQESRGVSVAPTSSGGMITWSGSF